MASSTPTINDLVSAVKRNDILRVRVILASSAAPNIINQTGVMTNTPLSVAVTSQDVSVEIVRDLIYAGANVEGSLRDALSGGDPAKVAALVDAGANIHFVDENGYNAMLCAVYGRRIDSDPNLLELIAYLSDRAVSPTAVSSYNETVLRTLSRYCRFDAVKKAIDYGADASQLQFTPIHKAIAFGTIDELAAALRSCDEIETQDDWGRTPLALAVRIGSKLKAMMLLESGANIDARADCGEPMLFFAVRCISTSILTWLLDHGVDTEITDNFGRTALCEAVDQDNEDAVDILISRGANTNISPPSGAPLFHTLSAKIARSLITAGADTNAISAQGRRAVFGLTGEWDLSELDVSYEDFLAGRARRFGKSNPDLMNEPFWLAMIRSGSNGYLARAKYGESPIYSFGQPVWCANRFGQSITYLTDGRIVQIAGEHEDGADPDFCIYNDVFVHRPDGKVDIFGYPQKVFPPTDFHTATLVGNDIFIIGSLGYSGKRPPGTTPVFRLNTEGYKIKPMRTVGECPGRIYNHRAQLTSASRIQISGGVTVRAGADGESHDVNNDVYELDIESSNWRKL